MEHGNNFGWTNIGETSENCLSLDTGSCGQHWSNYKYPYWYLNGLPMLFYGIADQFIANLHNISAIYSIVKSSSSVGCLYTFAALHVIYFVKIFYIYV